MNKPEGIVNGMLPFLFIVKKLHISLYFNRCNHKQHIFIPNESSNSITVFRVHLYLSQLIDLPVDTEHALPWYPPVCTEQQKEQDITLGHNQGFAPETDLKPQLLKYGDERHSVEAEIGQRILTAITKVRFEFIIFKLCIYFM